MDRWIDAWIHRYRFGIDAQDDDTDKTYRRLTEKKEEDGGRETEASPSEGGGEVGRRGGGWERGEEAGGPSPKTINQ